MTKTYNKEKTCKHCGKLFLADSVLNIQCNNCYLHGYQKRKEAKKASKKLISCLSIDKVLK